jgi:hypothetical protein
MSGKEKTYWGDKEIMGGFFTKQAAELGIRR